MNIRDLRYFLAVAEFGHFGKAADYCHVSQPTLSGQIKKLEESLDIKLFERNNRNVLLTEEGHHIMVHAKRVIKEVESIQDVAASSKDPLAGRFKLGAFPTIATYLFPQVVSHVKKSMPDLRLILIEEKTASLIDQLKNGDLDAAIIAYPVPLELFESAVLFDDEFLLAVPNHHELISHTQIDQNTLNRYHVLLLEEGHCLRDQSLDVCQMHGIAEEQDFKATSLETLRQMVKAGSGITFMPQTAIQEGEKGITYIPFKAPAPKRTIGLFWRKSTTRMAVIQQLLGAFSTELNGAYGSH